MLLANALLALIDSGSDVESDIIVVTGKGLRSHLAKHAKNQVPVLIVKVPHFLENVAGMRITPVEGNEGRFIVTIEEGLEGMGRGRVG